MSGSASSRRTMQIISGNPNFVSRKHQGRQRRVVKRVEHTTQLQGLDLNGWKDDDLSLRNAAAQSCLTWNRMTERELEAFPRMANSGALTTLFLFYRNKILVLWHLDPLIELTVEDVLKEIHPPNSSDERLITGVHAFLQRYGYINFGVFIVRSKILYQVKRKVVVIGAGIAGLAAARQLRFFGFEVKVLEARPRVGGRVMTYHVGKNFVELGAQIVMGITGNPIITLAKQLPVDLVRVSNKCQIYDQQGKVVDPRKNTCVKASFDKILQTCAYIAHGLGISEINGEKLSLGQCFDLILDQQELQVQERRLAYWSKCRDLCTQMRVINETLAKIEVSIDKTMSELRKHTDLKTATFDTINMDLSDTFSTDEESYYDAITVKCLRQSLETAVKSFDDLTEERKEVEQALTDLKSLNPKLQADVYMNNTDKHILDFYLANLECRIGGSLYSIPLKEWEQVSEFKGSQVMVREGYSDIMKGLTNDLNVERESIVDKIEYNNSGVRIMYAHRKPDKTMTRHTIEADAVICTLPLGVLKKSVKSELANCVKFDPPLPEWKQRSIENLGYGTMNKIALMFEKPFWDTNSPMFGRLNESSKSRGEMFLFFSNGVSPVLTCLLVGKSALIEEQVKEEILMQRAMDILGNIFGNACPKKPISHVMTLWHRDRFTRGCYSYIATNSTAQDYDTLAIPLKDREGVPRVLFAGEHTSRMHPGTVHGAFLSGIREAAVVADHFIGPIYSSDRGYEPEQNLNGIHFEIKEEDNVENGS